MESCRLHASHAKHARWYTLLRARLTQSLAWILRPHRAHFVPNCLKVEIITKINVILDKAACWYKEGGRKGGDKVMLWRVKHVSTLLHRKEGLLYRLYLRWHMNGVCWQSDNDQQSQLAYFSTKRVTSRDGSAWRDSLHSNKMAASNLNKKAITTTTQAVQTTDKNLRYITRILIAIIKESHNEPSCMELVLQFPFTFITRGFSCPWKLFRLVSVNSFHL